MSSTFKNIAIGCLVGAALVGITVYMPNVWTFLKGKAGDANDQLALENPELFLRERQRNLVGSFIQCAKTEVRLEKNLALATQKLNELANSPNPNQEIIRKYENVVLALNNSLIKVRKMKAQNQAALDSMDAQRALVSSKKSIYDSMKSVSECTEESLGLNANGRGTNVSKMLDDEIMGLDAELHAYDIYKQSIETD